MNQQIQDLIYLRNMMQALAPIFLTTVIFAHAAVQSKDKSLTFYNFAYHLNPRRGLFSQYPLLFWLSTIFLYFLAAGHVCWSPYTLSFTPKGFDTFIEISKFPLGVLSLTVPIGVFISRLHSTQQTAAQIEATDMKNRLDAFHAQRKGIVEYIASLGTIKLAHQVSLKLQINQAFHTAIFCNSTHTTGAMEADAKVIKDIVRRVDYILDDLSFLLPTFELLKDRTLRKPTTDRDGIYFEIMKSANDLCVKLSITDYVVDTLQERSMFKVILSSGQEERHARLANNYYELIAILNYSITVSYYAMISENRSEDGWLMRLQIEQLKKELYTLGLELSQGIDQIQIYSTKATISPQPFSEAVSEASLVACPSP